MVKVDVSDLRDFLFEVKKRFGTRGLNRIAGAGLRALAPAVKKELKRQLPKRTGALKKSIKHYIANHLKNANRYLGATTAVERHEEAAQRTLQTRRFRRRANQKLPRLLIQSVGDHAFKLPFFITGTKPREGKDGRDKGQIKGNVMIPIRAYDRGVSAAYPKMLSAYQKALDRFIHDARGGARKGAGRRRK